MKRLRSPFSALGMRDLTCYGVPERTTESRGFCTSFSSLSLPRRRYPNSSWAKALRKLSE